MKSVSYIFYSTDRNNYGYERGYENTRGYPAQVYRGMDGGYYDNRNYRPYDETYRYYYNYQ